MNNMTEPQEKKRFYNELKKIKTNAYNCFMFVLKIVILIREHKSLLMDNVIKDGSKDFSLKILKLKIGEIVTLKLDDDKDYQITNENIILNNNSNDLIMELLNKTFLEFIKTDFLLSNEQFNKKYKLKESGKFLLENHFKAENDKKTIKDLINNLNERFNKLRKGNLRNKKMELIPSEKIKKLLEDYSKKKNSSDSTSDNLEPENSEITQNLPIDYSQDNLLQNASKQSNSYPNESNDSDELMQSTFLEHDYNYNETKKDISSEDVEPEYSEITQNLLDDNSQDNLLQNASTQSNSYPNEINDSDELMQSTFLEHDYNYYETKKDISSEDDSKEDFDTISNPNEINGYDELMQSTILECDYNYNETKKDISSEGIFEKDFEKAFYNAFMSDYVKKKNFEIKYNEKK